MFINVKIEGLDSTIHAAAAVEFFYQLSACNSRLRSSDCRDEVSLLGVKTFFEMTMNRLTETFLSPLVLCPAAQNKWNLSY